MEEDQRVPHDVPWQKLAFGATLTQSRDSSTIGSRISLESVVSGLTPSLSLFHYVPPSTSKVLPDSRPFPGSRILLLRIASSLTGMRLSETMRFNLFGRSLALPRSEYLPCIGAVVQVRIGSPDLPRRDKPLLYVRDVLPKHQEMVLNEVLGTESLERQLDRNSVTKNWNVSGGFTVKGLNVGGGASKTEISESQRERSETLSHILNVSHVYHVLTAYHVGGDSATLTIQPRPYEGESWELLGGPRRVEGIQDLILVVQAPHNAATITVEACLNIGFLGEITHHSLPPRPEDPRSIADAFHSSSASLLSEILDRKLDKAAQRIESWEKWVERYQRWLRVREFVRKVNTTPRVVVARLCASGEMQFQQQGLSVRQVRPNRPRFADMDTESTSRAGIMSSPALGATANSLASAAVETLKGLNGQDLQERLSSTAYCREKRWEQIRELPAEHPVLQTKLESFGILTSAEKTVLSQSGIKTLGNLASAPANRSRRPRTSAALLRISEKLVSRADL